MKKRNTGINLFKLFSMFMIALLHVLGMGGITGATAGTSSYYPVYLMQNAAFCAVNCYALISGYLMLGKKIKPSRITELWFEVFFLQRRSVRDYDINIPRIFQRAEYSLCTDSDNFKSVLVHDRVFSDVFIHPDDEQIRRGGR